MATARARRGDERVRGNIETRGDSLRVFAGADARQHLTGPEHAVAKLCPIAVL